MQALELVPQAPKPDDYLMNSREVAKMLGVDVSWVKNHCTRYEPMLPFVKLGSGRYITRRFRRSDILQFIDDQIVRPKRRRAA